MIRPEQVRPVGSKPLSHERHCEALEKLCDDAIQCADRDQQWPARVPRIREPLGAAAIKETAEKYRGAGWCVLTCTSADAYMVIDRPGPGQASSIHVTRTGGGVQSYDGRPRDPVPWNKA